MNTDAGAGAGQGAGANPPQPPQAGQNQPNQNRERRGRRRRRRGGQKGGGGHQQQAGGQQQQPKQQGGQPHQAQPRHHRRDRQQNEDNRGNRRQGGRQRRGPGAFVGPMDHSYRGVNGEANGNVNYNGSRARGVMFHQPSPFDDVEHAAPVAANVTETAAPRIFAFIEELFFFAKIQEISKKLGIKVEFVKSEKEVTEKVEETGEQPSLIIFDLNNAAAKPLITIPKLRKEYKKGTSILGFVSHVQGDLKVKAQEAGCDVVMPRSAFSQNLVGLLRRHGLPDEEQGMD